MLETQNHIFILNKQAGESSKYYNEKCRFMNKFTIHNEKVFNYYLKYANIHCNKLFYNIKYSNIIEKQLLEIIN